SESFIHGISGGTWMPLAVQSGTEAILRTTASVSVSVGSESVITAGSVQTYNPIGIGSILITNVTPSPVNIITVGSSAALTSGNDTSFITKIITTGSTYYLTGFDLTGTADGKFSIYNNAIKQLLLRTNAAEQNISRSFSSPLRYSTGSIVVKVEHGETLSQTFEGVLYGFEETT
ncbi:MAG: hypothetical protein IIC74_05390, partial [Bacteroidetes bacterium]|nr:hypothetical protein [Bacteroidota bacterium]